MLPLSSTFFYKVQVAMKMKISSVTLVLKAFLWDKDLNCGPETPRDPSPTHLTPCPCPWCSMLAASQPRRPARLFLPQALGTSVVSMWMALSPLCTWLRFAQPLGLIWRISSLEKSSLTYMRCLKLFSFIGPISLVTILYSYWINLI